MVGAEGFAALGLKVGNIHWILFLLVGAFPVYGRMMVEEIIMTWWYEHL